MYTNISNIKCVGYDASEDFNVNVVDNILNPSKHKLEIRNDCSLK